MPAGPIGSMRSHNVYEELRAGILRGERSPGSPLRAQELSAQFGVSLSVIREALTKLVERNLVKSAPNAGFRVVEATAADLMDLLDMRLHIEGAALARSIELGDLDWAAGVISAHYVLENTPYRNSGNPGTTDEWSIAHVRFHDALCAACASPRLLAFTHVLRDNAELYRQLSRTSDNVGRDVLGEHRHLMELATTRQVDAAREALEAHLTLTAQSLLGGIFADDTDVRTASGV